MKKATKQGIPDKKAALLKMANFCAYQERCQLEVRRKLMDLGMCEADADEVLMELIVQNFINEERFAKQYTSGKFNIKHWGRLKIKHGLKAKDIPEKLIQKALKDIDEGAYLNKMEWLLEKKSALLSEQNPILRQKKLQLYLQSKGYENNLIFILLKNT